MKLPELEVVAYLEGNPEGIWFVAYSPNDKVSQKPLVTLDSANAAIKEAYEQGKRDAVPEWLPIDGENAPEDTNIAVLYQSGQVSVTSSAWVGKAIVKPYNRPAMPVYMASIDSGMIGWIPLPAARKQEK